ncbi:MAG: hypothetical protein H8D23_17685 [Candidatus Brocadiales bacterium]|nr:hypothetical protein [Candidatus Brocadiales bacterium]
MSFLNYLSPNGPQRQLISQLMSTNGDGTGTVDFIGDDFTGLNHHTFLVQGYIEEGEGT